MDRETENSGEERLLDRSAGNLPVAENDAPPTANRDDPAALSMRMPVRAVAPRGIVVPAPSERLSAAAASRGLRKIRDREVAELQPQGDEDETAFAPLPLSLPLPLPRRRKRWSFAAVSSFLLMVALPVAVGSAYYGFIATDQYVSEFHFSVRDEATAMPANASNSTLLQSLNSTPTMSGGGTAPAGADVLSDYIVVDYIQSEQGLRDVERQLPLRSYFSKEGVDWWSRLDPTASREKLLKYWQRMVLADYDPAKGIATVDVRAFTPADAHAIAVALAANAEKLVNGMEERARQDAVGWAERTVAQGEKKLQAAAQKLLLLRKKSGVIDPTSSVVTDEIDLVRTLRLSLSQLQTQYEAIAAQTPRSPFLPGLAQSIKATEDQLAMIKSDIAPTAKGAVLPSMVGEFENATLENQLAQQTLTADIATLETARINAIAQSVYVMEHAQPNLPQSSIYPRRLLTILLVVLTSLGVWIGAGLFVHSIKARLV